MKGGDWRCNYGAIWLATRLGTKVSHLKNLQQNTLPKLTHPSEVGLENCYYLNYVSFSLSFISLLLVAAHSTKAKARHVRPETNWWSNCPAGQQCHEICSTSVPGPVRPVCVVSGVRLLVENCDENKKAGPCAGGRVRGPVSCNALSRWLLFIFIIIIIVTIVIAFRFPFFPRPLSLWRVTSPFGIAHLVLIYFRFKPPYVCAGTCWVVFCVLFCTCAFFFMRLLFRGRSILILLLFEIKVRASILESLKCSKRASINVCTTGNNCSERSSLAAADHIIIV